MGAFLTRLSPCPLCIRRDNIQGHQMAAGEVVATGISNLSLDAGPADANLGFFGEDGSEKAATVFVLVVHYPKGNETGTDNDVKKLKETFSMSRKCRFFAFSPLRDELLEYLASENKLKNSFRSSLDPDIFIIVFLAHGEKGGKIQTSDGEFTTAEIYQKLEKTFPQCLKLLFLGPCRGDAEENCYQTDHQDTNKFMRQITDGNENMFKVSLDPKIHNMVVFYATMEGYASHGHLDGTWMVRSLCEVLDEMRENLSLLDFLTRVLIKINNIQHGECFKQTPKFKISTLGKKFTFIPNKTNQDAEPTPATVAETSSSSSPHGNGYLFEKSNSWKNKDGKLPRKRALICCHNQEFLKLREKFYNYGFDDVRTHDIHSENEYLKLLEPLDLTDGYGCLAVFIYAQISDDGIYIDGKPEKTPIHEWIQKFLSIHSEIWKGRPILLFFINNTFVTTQGINTPKSSDSSKVTQHTKQSNWLALVIKDANKGDILLQMFARVDGRSLQEYLGDLLIVDTPEETLQITLISTLQEHFHFPPRRRYVHPKFSVQCGQDLKEKKDLQSLTQHISEYEYRFIVISALAGSGKTELLNQLKIEFRSNEVLEIPFTSVIKSDSKSPPFKSFTDIFEQKMNKKKGDTGDSIFGESLLLFDGFHELTKIKRGKIQQFFKTAMSETKIPKIFISIRPQDEKYFKDLNNAVYIKILPFDEIRQKYLLDLHIEGKIDCQDEHKTIVRNVFRKLVDQKFSDVLSNPRNLTLLIDVIYDNKDAFHSDHLNIHSISKLLLDKNLNGLEKKIDELEIRLLNNHYLKKNAADDDESLDYLAEIYFHTKMFRLYLAVEAIYGTLISEEKTDKLVTDFKKALLESEDVNVYIELFNYLKQDCNTLIAEGDLIKRIKDVTLKLNNALPETEDKYKYLKIELKSF